MQKSSGNGKRAYRRHDIKLKRQLAILSCEPGASVAAIAREHGINANMLFSWRKKYCPADTTDTALLLPVHVQADGGQTGVVQRVARSSPRTIKRNAAGPLIEIEVSGVLVRLRGVVDEASLCSVLRAVRGLT